jgi:ABC-type nitrate/sulfonate/bicarbonate transport system permease component
MSTTTAVKAGRLHPPSLAPIGRIGGGMASTIASLAAGAFIWEIGARIWNVRFLPPLSAVLSRLAEMTADGVILASLGNSLINLSVGFGIALAFGVGIGLLMGAYRKIEMALDWWVYALDTAPGLVFAPIFFAIFGLGPEPIIAVIVMYSIFTMIVNTVAGIRGVPRALIEMGRSYCATDRQLFWRIILPAATPLIMAGVRIGMGKAVKGMINGEMFIAAVGLGAVVINANRRFDSAAILAVLLVTIVVAVVTVKLVQVIDARLTSWLPATQRKRRANA